MTDCRQQLAQAIRATTFHSQASYSWFGRRMPPLPRAARLAYTPRALRAYIVASLQLDLYQNFYCAGAAVPASTEPEAPALFDGITPFVASLSAANTGTGFWKPGSVLHVDGDGRLIVRTGRLNLALHADDYRTSDGGVAVSGGEVAVRFPKESYGVSPGFYMAFSDAPLSLDDAGRLVRFYWHLVAEAAPQFMRSTTEKLNAAHLPFCLKVLADPAQFTRCDVIVLYARKSDYGVVSETLSRIYDDVRASMRPAVPVFTKRLADGVALAEDPPDGESFGLHRSHLLAEALMRAEERGHRTVADRLEFVRRHFARRGVTLREPYLEPGSTDQYERGPWLRAAPRSAGTRRQKHSVVGLTYLGTACAIARRIAGEAIWHDDRCTWVAFAAPSGSARHGPSGSYSALGPTLYDGTSGVALFLAELSAVTGDPEIRRTALGAARQALASAVSTPLASLGLYDGNLGVALASARAGVVLGDDSLRERAWRLAERCARARRRGADFDLISGSAGSIIALLALHRIFDDRMLLESAVKHGDALMAGARRAEGGLGWTSVVGPRRRPLTGLSHGSAGIGYALLELFREVGERRYVDTAEAAFGYERHWFDEQAANWPDFRLRAATRPRNLLVYSTTWCHGAPGIAASRLRGYAVVGSAEYRDEAVVALITTRRMVEHWLAARTANYSLCHGLAGNAEVLLEGRSVSADGAADESLVHEVARRGIETYAQRGAWPCGAGHHETPTLMVGLAGIGLFYLRLAHPECPSILLPSTERFA